MTDDTLRAALERERRQHAVLLAEQRWQRRSNAWVASVSDDEARRWEVLTAEAWALYEGLGLIDRYRGWLVAR